MKKTTVISILEHITHWLPIFIYSCFNIETLYSTAEKGITVSAIVLCGAVLFYLKDQFKEWIKSPSAFKYVVILWIISLIFVVLGNMVFEIASVLLASFLATIPLEAWRKALNKDVENDAILQKLKGLLNP